MKILYSIQATGNGHISRAKEIVPILKTYGEVDCMLSGDYSQLSTDELPIKYRSKGLSFYYNDNGGLDYWKTIKRFNPIRIWKDAKALPVEKYDIVINDFDSITALSCRIKKVGSVAIGNQYSFLSKKIPKAKCGKFDTFIGEMVLKHIAKATRYIAFNYKEYDSFIYNPIIKKSIVEATPIEGEHILVYLPQYPDKLLIHIFSELNRQKFHIFSKTAKVSMSYGNITVFSINDSNGIFDTSLINCKGVITAGGFQLTSEALYLGKRLMCIPIQGQYEQLCNAVAIKEFAPRNRWGISDNPIYLYQNGLDYDCLLMINTYFNGAITPQPKRLELKYSTKELVDKIIEQGVYARNLNKISSIL